MPGLNDDGKPKGKSEINDIAVLHYKVETIVIVILMYLTFIAVRSRRKVLNYLKNRTSYT